MRMTPSDGDLNPDKSWYSEDFPAPVLPTIAILFPASTLNETELSAGLKFYW
jgi:hypothetical protein